MSSRRDTMTIVSIMFLGIVVVVTTIHANHEIRNHLRLPSVVVGLQRRAPESGQTVGWYKQLLKRHYELDRCDPVGIEFILTTVASSVSFSMKTSSYGTTQKPEVNHQRSLLNLHQRVLSTIHQVNNRLPEQVDHERFRSLRINGSLPPWNIKK